MSTSYLSKGPSSTQQTVARVTAQDRHSEELIPETKAYVKTVPRQISNMVQLQEFGSKH